MSANHPVARAGALTGSIVCWLVLAGIIVVVLDLLSLAAAAPRAAVQALDRSAEAVVTLERQAKRSGHIMSYPIRF
jgi:hypothetical protein